MQAARSELLHAQCGILCLLHCGRSVLQLVPLQRLLVDGSPTQLLSTRDRLCCARMEVGAGYKVWLSIFVTIQEDLPHELP